MNRSNADKNKDRLLMEISDAVTKGCREVVEKLNKMEERRRKVVEMMDVKRQRSEEVKLLISQNDKLFQSAEPEEMERVSSMRMELAKEKTEIEALLDDLETRTLPLIDSDLLEIRKELNERVQGFMYARKRHFEEEVYFLIHDVIEPKILAWQEFFDAMTPKYNISFGQRQVLRDIQFYSPLVLEACDTSSNPRLIKMAQDIRNGKKPGETESPS